MKLGCEGLEVSRHRMSPVRTRIRNVRSFRRFPPLSVISQALQHGEAQIVTVRRSWVGRSGPEPAPTDPPISASVDASLKNSLIFQFSKNWFNLCRTKTLHRCGMLELFESFQLEALFMEKSLDYATTPVFFASAVKFKMQRRCKCLSFTCISRRTNAMP